MLDFENKQAVKRPEARAKHRQPTATAQRPRHHVHPQRSSDSHGPIERTVVRTDEFGELHAATGARPNHRTGQAQGRANGAQALATDWVFSGKVWESGVLGQ